MGTNNLLRLDHYIDQCRYSLDHMDSCVEDNIGHCVKFMKVITENELRRQADNDNYQMNVDHIKKILEWADECHYRLTQIDQTNGLSTNDIMSRLRLIQKTLNNIIKDGNNV